MIYVYAVVEVSAGSSPPPTLRAAAGLEERRVELRTSGGIGAAFTYHASDAIPATPENVWVHERVVESLMRDGAVLPARFGTIFRAETAVELALGTQTENLRSGLDRVRGCVELGVRVLWPRAGAAPDEPVTDTPMDGSQEPPAGSGPGRAYMMARLARERRSREAHHMAVSVAADVHNQLIPLARDGTWRIVSEPAPQLAAAYLVAREQADSFDARVRQLAARNPNLRLLCTGPWPPYHFVPALLPSEAIHA